MRERSSIAARKQWVKIGLQKPRPNKKELLDSAKSIRSVSSIANVKVIEQYESADRHKPLARLVPTALLNDEDVIDANTGSTRLSLKV